jgi:cobalt ECF transporter T component CbiQ
MRAGFVERTIEDLHRATDLAVVSERIAEGGGLLQRIDPRVKLAGLVALIVAAAVARSLEVLAGLFALSFGFAIASRVPIRTLATRAWVGALVFSGTIALPAIALTPGRVVARPLGIEVTLQGLRSATFLVGRVETAATFALLLVVTTPWGRILAALRAFRVPVVFVVILGMTYRYVFVLLRSAHDMFMARRSRSLGLLPRAERRRLATATAGVLLSKTYRLSEEVYLAMQARGFRGEVFAMDDARMRGRDWIAAVSFAACAGTAVWLGR